MKNGIILVGLLIAWGVPASADEVMVPLAQGGEWITSAHRASLTARPDMCLTADFESGIAIRADGHGIQIRIINSRWSLPAGVIGDVAISVGGWKETFKIDDNTDTMINSEIDEDDALAMFAAMDANASMSVTVGKAKPFPVSLVGSTKATNAFRTCAGLKGANQAPGVNPFSTQP